MLVFALITGKVLSTNEFKIGIFEFLYEETDPFFYYLINFIYALLGFGLFYKSLLFIPKNREALIKKEGFDRRFVGLEKEEQKVNKLRVLIVTFMSILIILLVYYIFMVL